MKVLVALLGMAVAGWAGTREDSFRSRVNQVIAHNAHGNTGYQHIAAKLYLKQDAAWASQKLIELLKDPTGDMFWMFPATAVAFLDKGQLTPEARGALRQAWKTYMPNRGDTENHWLLYYTCLYLMSQMYPNEGGETWYTGKTSAENMQESETWILKWMETTTTIGQGEYDCTHYIGVYLLPLSYLAEWAKDPAMRKRARMMLDWVIADYAVEQLNGIYAGSHARTDDKQVLEKWDGVSSDFGWILFGLGHPLPGYSYYGFFYVAASAYQPPLVIERIATDRSQDYVHYERKRTRNRWRYSDLRNAPVYKTTYMQRDYAVGSDQGGLLQPIQQHSWDVTWNVDDPRSAHNTMFSTHPYSSVFELQMYFTGMPDFITEAVARSKKTYDSPDKFLGGSRYEQIVQNLDTVVALYDIPADARFPHVHGFFSRDLTPIVEHPSGWLFARGGRTYLAYKPLAKWEWRLTAAGDRRLYSPHLKNGTIVQAASVDEFPSFEAFQQKIAGLPLTVELEPRPAVTFQTIRNHRIEVRYGEVPRVDGAAIRYDDWKLFQGPYLNAEVGSRRLVLTHGKLRRTIDFNRMTVEDEEQ
ncbi:MAG: hypothetical protein IT168_01395 [Bryobacterales bacterium]|nr:hypothetical protein [Bryobacterales bacterium]